MKSLDEKEELLIEAALRHAIILVEEYGEFYPIAFGIRKISNEIVPVSPYMEKEQPEVGEVLVACRQALERSDIDNNFIGLCICINVNAENDQGVLIPALELRFKWKTEPLIQYNLYFEYEMQSGELIVLNEYKAEGTYCETD